MDTTGNATTALRSIGTTSNQPFSLSQIISPVVVLALLTVSLFGDRLLHLIQAMRFVQLAQQPHPLALMVTQLKTDLEPGGKF
jgi:hypothetical protein